MCFIANQSTFEELLYDKLKRFMYNYAANEENLKKINWAKFVTVFFTHWFVTDRGCLSDVQVIFSLIYMEYV